MPFGTNDEVIQASTSGFGKDDEVIEAPKGASALPRVEIPTGQKGKAPSKEDSNYIFNKKTTLDSIEGKGISVPLAGLEAGLNLMGGVGGAMIGAPLAAMSPLTDLVQGKPMRSLPDIFKTYEEILTAGAGTGTNLAEAAGLRSQEGDWANQKLAQVMNDIANPLIGVDMPAIRGAGLGMKMLGSKFKRTPEVPTIDPLANLEKSTPPQAAPVTSAPQGPFHNPNGVDIEIPQGTLDQQAIFNREPMPEQVPGRVDQTNQMELPFAAGPEEIVREKYMQDFTSGEPMQRDFLAEQDLTSRDRDPYGDNLARAEATRQMEAQEQARKQQQIEEAYRLRDEAKKYEAEQQKALDFDEQLSKLQEELSVERVSKGQQAKAASRMRGGSQVGAINLPAVKAAIDDFKQGATDAVEVLRAFKGAFTENEHGLAMKSLTNPKSRDTVVLLSPDQFHELAQSRHPEEIAKHAARLHESIREGLKSREGLWEMPYLRVNEEGQVTAHEGRHRMDVFKEQGLDLVPVRLRADGKPWGEWKIPKDIYPEKMKGDRFKDIRHLYAQPFPEIMTKKPEAPKLAPGKSQRGQIHNDLLTLGLGTKMRNYLESRVVPDNGGGTPAKNLPKITQPSSTAEVLADLPGGKQVTKNWIPSDPTTSEILSKAKQEKDSNIRFPNLQAGASLTAIKTESSLIDGIGQLGQNRDKRVDLFTRENIYPVERQFKELSQTEMMQLAGLMKREMFEGKVHTAEQLKEAGWTPKQIEAWQGMRQLYSQLLAKQNEALAMLGKEPMSPKEYYLSSRWGGDWRIPVYEKYTKADGSEGSRLAWYISEKTEHGAKKALEYLKNNEIVDPKTGQSMGKLNIDFDKSKPYNKHDLGRTRTGEVFDAYRTMLNILDEGDPRGQALKSVMEDYIAEAGFETLGQSKHFENKANIRGFIGDRPWKNPKKDTYELFHEQFQYAKNGINWAESMNMVKTAKEVLSDPMILENQPRNHNFAQQYIKGKLGFGENQAVAAVEKEISKALGFSKGQADALVGSAKTLFILTKLGLNTGFHIANFLQPLVITPTYHSLLSSKGYKHNSFLTLLRANLDGAGGYFKHTGMFDVDFMSDIGKKALEYAEDNGIVSRDIYDESANLGKHPAVEKTEQTLGYAMKEIEHAARLQAFMSFVHHLEQSGKFPDTQKLFQEAEKYTNASMVDYRPGERPMMFDKLGTMGSALGTLQTYKYNYYNTLGLVTKEAARGNPMPAVYFLGMSMAMGGVLALPFLNDLDMLWEKMKDWLPADLQHKVQDFGIKKFILDNLPDVASMGGLSAATGANFSSRFEPSSLFDYSLDSAFPIFTDLFKQGEALGSAVTSPTNSTKAAGALYALAPPGPAQGLVETLLPQFKAGTTPDGKTIYQNPRDLMSHKASIERTPTQEKYRMAGLVELGEAKEKALKYYQGRDEARRLERQRATSQDWFDSVVRGDEKDVEKYATRYILYGGNPETLINSLTERTMQMKIPRDKLEAMKARSLGAVQKAKRYKELLEDVNK